MAKVILHLLDPEMNALHRLAQQEYRSVKSQAAIDHSQRTETPGHGHGAGGRQCSGTQQIPRGRSARCSMTELVTDECILTPEQRRRLGQAYRWRQERKKGTQQLPAHQSTELKIKSAQRSSNSASSTESES